MHGVQHGAAALRREAADGAKPRARGGRRRGTSRGAHGAQCALARRAWTARAGRRRRARRQHGRHLRAQRLRRGGARSFACAAPRKRCVSWRAPARRCARAGRTGRGRAAEEELATGDGGSVGLCLPANKGGGPEAKAGQGWSVRRSHHTPLSLCPRRAAPPHARIHATASSACLLQAPCRFTTLAHAESIVPPTTERRS